MNDTQTPAPLVLINTFTAPVGGMDALIDFQSAETERMSVEATAHGWLGNELYRALDGTSLIIVTRFRSPEARARWAETSLFRRHVEELRPLVLEVVSTPVAFVTTHGETRIHGGS